MLERPAQFNSLLSVVLGEWTAPTP
jgi:hypothetical protein